ncbi:MAG: hypothetical protein RL181_1836 [Bacteroidota bacterium]|jgi:uncharacterized protein YyaL (SSP411 family)
MNRLKFETSPYLLQHAGNPVHWHAWKPEAFERARKEGKPILVSIGYSTCHWCHVMERESFEDPAVAAFMNAHFINIKVDREERPDVDHIYMEACHVIGGSGGWPLNCFLTPDGRPFYAGTYYPPKPAYNRPSWMQLMGHLSELFQREREKIEAQADRILQLIRQSGRNLTSPLADMPFPSQAQDRAQALQVYQSLRPGFDLQDGGFGGAPKFPGTMTLQFLLEYHFYTGEDEALQHVLFSLDQMIRGGLYDQIGGGFARYTVDKAWRVPHFEKMLYDNALLVGLLSDVYRHTGTDRYAETIRHTLDFIQREMTSPEGGFYSALDADSEGVEGKFYVWTQAELNAALGEDAPWFCAYSGTTPEGNWEHSNILWRPPSDEDFAAEWGMSLHTLRERRREACEKLFKVRARRVPPGLDDKILLDWNAMMCTAFARAYTALGDPIYRDIAERSIGFLLNRFKKPDSPGFYHAYAATSDGGRAHIDAFLDDYANLVEALFEVYAITLNPFYLRHAQAILPYILTQFSEEGSALFYFAPATRQDLVVRKKELLDSATPSGNAVLLRVLRRAAVYFGQRGYAERAQNMLQEMRGGILRFPGSFACWASTLLQYSDPAYEVAITGPQAGSFASQLHRHFLPNAVLMASEQPTLEFPLLAGKGFNNRTCLYVCSDFSCQAPVQTPRQALDMLLPLRHKNAHE